MYQHIIRHQHQVLPSPKERDSPHRSPSALITSWPEPAAATGALQHPVTSPAPQNTLFPPSSTPRMSAGVRGTRGHGREGAANPPRCYTHFPASTGPHTASPLSFPRDGETLPSAVSPPGPALNSGHRHPRTSRRSTVTLPVPSGVGAGPGRRQRGGEPPPAATVAEVTGEEVREDPRCSRRRREQGLRRKAPHGHHEKAENAGQTPPPPRPGGAGGSGRAATARRLPRAGQRLPRPLGTMQGHGGAEKAGAAAGLPRRSPSPTKPRGRSSPSSGPGTAPASSVPSPRTAGPAMMPAHRAGPGQLGPGLREHGGALSTGLPRQHRAERQTAGRAGCPRGRPPSRPSQLSLPPPGTAGSRLPAPT